MKDLSNIEKQLTHLKKFFNKLKERNYSYQTENGTNAVMLYNKTCYSLKSLVNSRRTKDTKRLEIQVNDLFRHINMLYLRALEEKKHILLRWSLGLTEEHQNITRLKENYRSSTTKPTIHEITTIKIVFSLIKHILVRRPELLSNILMIIKEIAQQKPELLFQHPDILQCLSIIRKNATREDDLKIFETFMALCKSDEKKLKDILGLETLKKQNNGCSSYALKPFKLNFPWMTRVHSPIAQKPQQQDHTHQQPLQKKQKLTRPVLYHTQTNTWLPRKPSHQYKVSQEKPRI